MSSLTVSANTLTIASMKNDTNYPIFNEKNESDKNDEKSEVNSKESLLNDNSSQTEKVSESDYEPENAEINKNPEYKDKAGKITETTILDLDNSSKAKDENLPTAKDELISNTVVVEDKTQKSIVTTQDSKSSQTEKSEFTESIKSEQKDENITLEDSEEEKVENIEQNIPSREVTLKNGQLLEVTYPGKGWSFIGDDSSKQNVIFMGRKLGQTDTIFTLRSKKAGETLLHFFKNDALTGDYIDDYLLVKISEDVAKGADKNKKISAPSYAEYVPPRPNRTRFDSIPESKIATTNENSFYLNNDNNSNVNKSNVLEDSELESINNNSQINRDELKTNIQKTNKKEATITKSDDKVDSKNEKSTLMIKEKEENIEDLFNQAKKFFDEKNYKEALSSAQKYLNYSTADTDEVLYLLGQIYESDSKFKNIKSSIDSYDKLVKDYPTSNLWNKAYQRLIYLKRFYIDIR